MTIHWTTVHYHSSSGEEADPYIEMIHQQQSGKKWVLSESPIAPHHLERSLLGKKSEGRGMGIACIKIVLLVLIDVCMSD